MVYRTSKAIVAKRSRGFAKCSLVWEYSHPKNRTDTAPDRCGNIQCRLDQYFTEKNQRKLIDVVGNHHKSWSKLSIPITIFNGSVMKYLQKSWNRFAAQRASETNTRARSFLESAAKNCQHRQSRHQNLSVSSILVRYRMADQECLPA